MSHSFWKCYINKAFSVPDDFNYFGLMMQFLLDLASVSNTLAYVISAQEDNQWKNSTMHTYHADWGKCGLIIKSLN